MRVLFLSIDPFGGEGGIAKFNRDLTSALGLHPACRSISFMPLKRLRRTQSVGGIPRQCRQIGSRRPASATHMQHTLRMLQETAQNSRRFDLIISGHLYLLPTMRWARKVNPGAKTLSVVHGVEAWQRTPRASVNAIAKNIDNIAGVSALTIDRFETWASPKTGLRNVLPNCVDLYRFTPGPKDPVLMARYGLRDKVVIASLGRMDASERYKGFDSILEILPRLRQRVPKLAYLCIGEGTDRERLMAKAEALGVAQHVIFPGKISEVEKVQHYRLADCFAMPGWGEGFGIVYLEALACGIPTVGSIADGSQEALLGGTLGTLVNPHDLESVELGILRTLQTKPVNREMLEHFSFKRFVERAHTLIDDVMGAPARVPSMAQVPDMN